VMKVVDKRRKSFHFHAGMCMSLHLVPQAEDDDLLTVIAGLVEISLTFVWFPYLITTTSF
jgi:hypothetical protein